jgi:glycosyltransferase involved in cell wall biosynthesis
MSDDLVKPAHHRDASRSLSTAGGNLSVTTLVSVVIPCHNYGRFLAAAIESVLAQSYADIQLIVVDDGSTDDTSAVAARYPTVRCLRQRNLGPGEACNQGMKEASGEFVVFLDADDELTPDAVETFVQCLQERPDCAFAYGHQELIDTRGSVITTRPKRSARLQTCLQEDPYAQMLRLNNPLRAPGAILYRSEAVKGVGGFARHVGNAQDLDLNLRLAREHPICCNDRIVLLTRVHDTNATRNYGIMLRGAVKCQRRQRSFVRRHPIYKGDYQTGLRLARSYWGSHLARQALSEARAGEIRSALRDLWTLSRFAPSAGALALAKRLIEGRH